MAQSKSLFTKAKEKLGWLAYLIAGLFIPLSLLLAAQIAITLLTPGLKQAQAFADKANLAASHCGNERQDIRCVRIYIAPGRYRDGIIVAATEARLALAVGRGAVRTIKVDDVIGVAPVPAPKPLGKSAEQLAKENYIRRCGTPSDKASDVLLGVPRLIDECKKQAARRAELKRLPADPSAAPKLLEAAKNR